MPLIANHGADVSVTAVVKVPSAAGVPATWIGDEHPPAATVMLLCPALVAPGTLKPKSVPLAMPVPAVLQTSMYPSVAGSTTATLFAANAGTAHRAAPRRTPIRTTNLRISNIPHLHSYLTHGARPALTR